MTLQITTSPETKTKSGAASGPWQGVEHAGNPANNPDSITATIL
jgi:hypothetical protein